MISWSDMNRNADVWAMPHEFKQKTESRDRWKLDAVPIIVRIEYAVNSTIHSTEASSHAETAAMAGRERAPAPRTGPGSERN